MIFEYKNFTSSTPQYSLYNIKIKADTTKKEFKAQLKKLPNFSFESAGSYGASMTPLATAAFVGNTHIIKYIVKIGGKKLLYIPNESGESPLHSAIKCIDLEKGYRAAITLIKLGTPIDIVTKYEKYILGAWTTCYTLTPLEAALRLKKIQIAAKLLRLGAYATIEPTMEISYQEAKNQMMTRNEKIFKLTFQDFFPKEVMRLILIISSKLL